MHLSLQENRLRLTAGIYAILFTCAVLVFIFAPTALFRIINAISTGLSPMLPLASDSGKFWLSMTVSMMATIITLSIFIYTNVRTYYMMAIPLAVAKFTSSFFGLAFFMRGFFFGETNTLANLIIFITDFPLGLIILVFWRHVKKSSPGA